MFLLYVISTCPDIKSVNSRNIVNHGHVQKCMYIKSPQNEVIEVVEVVEVVVCKMR